MINKVILYLCIIGATAIICDKSYSNDYFLDVVWEKTIKLQENGSQLNPISSIRTSNGNYFILTKYRKYTTTSSGYTVRSKLSLVKLNSAGNIISDTTFLDRTLINNEINFDNISALQLTSDDGCALIVNYSELKAYCGSSGCCMVGPDYSYFFKFDANGAQNLAKRLGYRNSSNCSNITVYNDFFATAFTCNANGNFTLSGSKLGYYGHGEVKIAEITSAGVEVRSAVLGFDYFESVGIIQDGIDYIMIANDETDTILLKLNTNFAVILNKQFNDLVVRKHLASLAPRDNFVRHTNAGHYLINAGDEIYLIDNAGEIELLINLGSNSFNFIRDVGSGYILTNNVSNKIAKLENDGSMPWILSPSNSYNTILESSANDHFVLFNTKQVKGDIIMAAINPVLETSYQIGIDSYSFTNYNIINDALFYSIKSKLLQVVENTLLGQSSIDLLLNIIWGYVAGHSGYCWGLSETSALYFMDPSKKPINKDLYSYSEGEALANVISYQENQIVPMTASIFSLMAEEISLMYGFDVSQNNDFITIRENLKGNKPTVISLMTEGGGHAVLAYKLIEKNGSVDVMIYDSNYPTSLNEKIIFNINSNEYIPTSQRYVIRTIHAYDPGISALSGISLVRSNYTGILDYYIQYYLDNSLGFYRTDCPADSLITDQIGRKIGKENDVYVNEVPYAKILSYGEIEIFELPVNTTYSVKVSGTGNGSISINTIVHAEIGAELKVYENMISDVTNNSVIQYQIDQFTMGNLHIDYNGDGMVDVLQGAGFLSALSYALEDSDSDSVLDIVDNCKFVYNPVQNDIDNDGEGDLCDCKGDLDNDKDIDNDDLAIFVFNFGIGQCEGYCEGDFAIDGDIDGVDLAVFIADFGKNICP